MDHGSESPSWLSGASAVGTGADPPDPDRETEADHDEHPYPADIGTARDTAEAPGFSDVPAPDHEDAAFPDHGFGEDAGYEEDAADAEGIEAPADAPGFADAPVASPGFGAAQPADAFGAPAADGYGSQPEAGPGFEHQGFHNPGYDHGPGYDNGQRGEYAGDYQGEYAGAYQGGGFGAAPPGHSYAGPGAAPAYGPVAGGYPGTQENGAPLRDEAPPFPGQYQPVEPPRSKVKASFRSFRRDKSPKRNRTGRQAQLTVARVEPWSVMKFSFVISLVAFIVLFVAVAALYGVLSGLGVFSALQRTITSITSSQSSSGFNLTTYLSASRVLGYTGLLGAINVVLITAAATVGSVLYNITADLAGGVEVTLKETD